MVPAAPSHQRLSLEVVPCSVSQSDLQAEKVVWACQAAQGRLWYNLWAPQVTGSSLIGNVLSPQNFALGNEVDLLS